WQGEYNAQINLGFLIREGLAQVANPGQKALQMYTMAAEQDHNVVAQCNLGLIYYRGFDSVPANKMEAQKWFSLAASGGNKKAQFFMGEMNEKGLGGLKPSEEKARAYYEKSAKQDFQPAKDALERLNSQSKDRHDLIQRADAGDSEAQFTVGVNYHDGFKG